MTFRLHPNIRFCIGVLRKLLRKYMISIGALLQILTRIYHHMRIMHDVDEAFAPNAIDQGFKPNPKENMFMSAVSFQILT